MLPKLILAFFFFFVSGVGNATLPKLEFSLHKNGLPNSGPTLLVIGGIQGDEPGGFTAASLLVTHYTITSGQVWVVPNLNFKSIIKRSRGIYGDMNRKFSKLKSSDPEFKTVQKIKQIITSPDVDIILNLHDGSGFYNERYIDALHNPKRWGQSLIIDQAKVGRGQYSHLEKLGEHVIAEVNRFIKQPLHQYQLKNTHTALGDKEMEKTLTYFAINHAKPAFGVEASKQFLTHRRAYYHLLVLEAFMSRIGITFERKFNLAEIDIKKAMYDKLQLAFYNKKVLLDVANARKYLNYVPLKKNADINYISDNPLVAVVSKNNRFNVRYGNRNLTSLKPAYFEYDDSLEDIKMSIDGNVKNISLGSIVDVRRDFNIHPIEGYRINVIGFTRKGVKDESNHTIKLKNIRRRFSVDKKSKIFRVEIYQGKNYCGMILVRFNAMERST
ncbi:succinylglutamate desuccinylase/aspartoacylase family protein [Beggiatoa alba]|nr:succinylglutamate desuccinylase/aspartoacylase family protein [Beggiatoa alba]